MKYWLWTKYAKSSLVSQLVKSKTIFYEIFKLLCASQFQNCCREKYRSECFIHLLIEWFLHSLKVQVSLEKLYGLKNLPLQNSSIKACVVGYPWWSCGGEPVLPMWAVGVQSLVGELRCRMPWDTAKNKWILKEASVERIMLIRTIESKRKGKK